MSKTNTVTVYPTKSSSLKLRHPTHGILTAAGAIWPHDGFTARRLKDGSVSRVAPAAKEEPKPAPKIETKVVAPSPVAEPPKA